MSHWKVYLKSSVITFVAACAGAVLSEWGHIVWSQVGIFALAGIVIRAGVKAVFEYLAILKA